MNFGFISDVEFPKLLAKWTLYPVERCKSPGFTSTHAWSYVSIFFILFIHTNLRSRLIMVAPSNWVSKASDLSCHVAGHSFTRCSGVSSASLHSLHFGSSLICNRLRCLLSTQCPVIVWISLLISCLFKLRIPFVTFEPALLINIFVCLHVACFFQRESHFLLKYSWMCLFMADFGTVFWQNYSTHSRRPNCFHFLP